MKITKIDNTHFRGLHIANAQTCIDGVSNSFKLYKVTGEDSEYLKFLYKNRKLENLMPKLNPLELEIWDSVFKDAVKSATYPEYNSFLLASGNKACGLAVTSVGFGKSYKLNYICTVPVERDKRVPFVGKTLCRQVFEDFLASGCGHIELLALKYGPFSAVSKYLQLGFGMCGGSDYVELMRISRPKVIKMLKNLDDLMSYTPVVETTKDVNLFSELYI